MKKKKWLVLPLLGVFLPLFLVIIMVVAIAGFGSNSSSGSSRQVDGVMYVAHWSGSDAYSHNLLARRYGIKAEQLDGFLDTLGIPYNKSRINGKLLLQWEQASGLDVRAIVAIAVMESSLGTAGVATMEGSNMFGYGAFDSNPENASHYNDEVAVVSLTKVTIIQNKNETFKIQDEKAQKNANGTLNAAVDGGVYFTDTSGSGKRRAEIMEKLDAYIDANGGTPEPPASKAGDNTVVDSLSESSIASIDTSGYIADSYPWGQCTWYVFNRAKHFGYSFDPYMGNGGDWKYKAGYQTTNEPKPGYAVSFSPGQFFADPTYGHIAIVEQVAKDGSVLISESNVKGLGVVSYRTFTPDQAKQLTYVIGH